MPAIAVIPVKSFDQGKARLGSLLDDESRKALGRELANRTVQAAEEAGMIPLVVAGDEIVEAWSLILGIPAITDPGTGLSAAAAAGTKWALEGGVSWVVVHADLPLLRPAELSPIVEAVEAGGEVIAPSSDGGTSLMGATRQVSFSYGPGSFARHLPRLRQPTIFASLGLLHDLDTPEDLTSASSHGRGRWLRETAL